MHKGIIRDEIEIATHAVPLEKNIIKLGEEAAELAAIILKGLFTGRSDYGRICEEIADVKICLEIVERQSIGITRDVEHQMEIKAERMRNKRLYESNRDAQQRYDISSSGFISTLEGFSFSTNKRNEPDEDCMPAPQEDSGE